MPQAVEKAIQDVGNVVIDALPYIGAVVGFVVGGVQGASAGYSLGKMGKNAIQGGGQAASASAFVASVQGRDQLIRSSVANRTVVYGRAMVSGPLVFGAVAGAGNKYLWLVIPVAGHEVDAIETIYLNELEVPLDGSGYATAAPYAGKVLVKKHLGADGDVADADLVAANVGWTSDHRLAGVAYLAIRLEWSSDVFPTGVPNVKCVVRGRKVYDPRTGLTAWSDNPALCVRDYITSAFGLEASSSEVDAGLLVAAANVCDEPVTLAEGGTESRYTCNGVVDTGDTPRGILEDMLTSMVGFVVWSGGLYQIHAGAYTAPAVTLTADDLRGPVRVRPRMSRKELFNAVRGTFVDPSAYWQPTDFPTVSNATYATQDGGQVIWRDAVLPYTTSAATAQRIAKLTLERSRQGITVELPCKLTAFKLATMDTVMVTLSQLGWAAKEFKVLEWSFSAEGGVNLVLQEETAASYNWNSGLETVVDPAPDTDLQNPFVVATPGAPTVTESLYQTTGSAGVKSRATISWFAVNDAFVVGYLPEYKLLEADEWTSMPMVREPIFELSDLRPSSYLFRVRAINTFNVKSEYSPIVAKEILGLTSAPGDVLGLSVTKIGGVAIAAWSLVEDLDVRVGGRIVIRHSSMVSGATWQDGVILEEFNGDAVTGLLPLISGTYMVKAKDSSGIYSLTSSSFIATEGMVTGFNTVATSTQAPNFDGSKDGVALVDGAIQLDGSLLISEMTGDVSTWPILSGLGGVRASGTYEFDSVLDLGSVATRRFEADLTCLSLDTGDFISFRGLVSDWDSISGAVINDCDATLYAATTEDDPAGSPVWSEWTPYFVGDFTCRAIKHRLALTSGSPTHNIQISNLTVHAKVPV